MPSNTTHTIHTIHTTHTAREVLQEVIRFHGDLASHYETLRDTVDETDSQLLLDYLSRHELSLQSTVHRCGTELREEALETPLPWSEHLPSARELPLLETPAVDAVVALGRRMDHTLIERYERLASSAPDASLRRLFRALLVQERQEQARLETARLCLPDL